MKNAKSTQVQEVAVPAQADAEKVQEVVAQVGGEKVRGQIQMIVNTLAKKKFAELEALIKEIKKIESPLTKSLVSNLESQRATIEKVIIEEELLPNIPFVGESIHLTWMEDRRYKVTFGIQRRARNNGNGNGNIPHWTSYNYPFTAQSVCDKLGIPVGSASANAVLWGKAGKTVEGVRKLVDQAMTHTTTQ